MGRDQQGPAGCRGWSPLCLVTTLLMPLVPGSATEESAYLCLSFQPPVWCLLLFPPLSQRPCLQEDSECQLQVVDSLCPVLKGEASTPWFLPMATLSKPPTLHGFINAMTYWFLLLLCLLHVILRSGRENPERLNSWWLLLGSSGKRSSWGRKWKRLTQKSFLVSLWLRLHHPCSQPLIDSCVCGLGRWAPIQGMEDTTGGCLDTHQDLTGFKLYLPDCVSLTFTHIF